MSIATDALRPAVELTSRLVFPFSWRKWFLLAVIVFFAGQGGMSVPNVNVGDFSDTQVPDFDVGGLLPLLIAGAVFALLIGLALLYLRSVFEFVLFDCVWSGAVRVRRSFNAYHVQGVSRFWYGIVIGVLALVVGGGLLAIGFAAFNVWQNIVLGVGVAAIGAVAIVALVLFDFFVRALVLPLMYFRKLRFLNALHDARKGVRGRWGELFIFFLLSLVLGVGAGLVILLALAVLLLGALVVAAVVFGLGFLVYSASEVLLVPLIVIGVLLAIPLVLAVLVALVFVMVPIRSFFAAYALVFARRLVLKKR